MNLEDIFQDLLSDQKFAKHLIMIFFDERLRHCFVLSKLERDAINDAYDNLTLFSALGLDIVGEKTKNTMIVARALADHHKSFLSYLDPNIFGQIIERIRKNA